MINVSTKCKRLIYSGERVYIVDATIELSNGTVLEPSNSQIMSDGLELDDAVGSDDDFNCIGSTIVNGCNLILYNNDRVFSDYDFINAVVTIEIKIDISDTNTPDYETISKGVFTVDDATWGDGIVTLVLLDNMCQFDRPYTSHNIYTATTTIYDVVLDACTKCGVTIAGTMTNMPNKNFVVAGPPKDDTTYREVIGWCAAIAGCFARCTTDGKLEFAWFDVDKFTADAGTDGGIFDEGTPYYTSGDTVNGGTFNPWNDQYNVDGGLFTDRSGIHHISALTSQNIGVDDVVITDVQIAYEVETANSSETNYYPTTIADNRYVISIDAIPFIDAGNVEDFYDILADRLIGLTFRTCNVTQINDPTIEAGDIAWLWDTRGEVHKILITRTTFSITGSQTIICGAKTPARNSATQMTAIAKANARSNRRLNEEKSIRQQLTDNFNNYVANAKGLYLSEITSGGTTIIYGHDKSQLAQSKMVLKISNGAISMTADYKGTDAATSAANAWFGFQFDGTWLANIISTVNLFFEYAHGGTLKLGGAGNGNGIIEVYDANDNPIGTWDNTGAVITGSLKMLGDTTYCTIGNTPTYVNYVVEGIVQRTLENLQFVIPYDSNGHMRAMKTFVKADTGNIQEILAIAGTIAQRLIVITTGSYLPEINTSSDVDKIRGYEERITYSSTNGAIYRIIPLVGSGHDTGLEIYKNHVKFGKFTCDGEGRIGANRELDIPPNSSSATIDGNTIAYASSSSKRYKHNIKPLSSDRDAHKLLELPIVEFEWNDGHSLQYKDMHGKTIPGIIAEDVEEIYPSAVIHNDDGEVESWDERRLIPGMLALIQEQQNRIVDLESRLKKLEHIITDLTNNEG